METFLVKITNNCGEGMAEAYAIVDKKTIEMLQRIAGALDNNAEPRAPKLEIEIIETALKLVYES